MGLLILHVSRSLVFFQKGCFFTKTSRRSSESLLKTFLFTLQAFLLHCTKLILLTFDSQPLSSSLAALFHHFPPSFTAVSTSFFGWSCLHRGLFLSCPPLFAVSIVFTSPHPLPIFFSLLSLLMALSLSSFSILHLNLF